MKSIKTILFSLLVFSLMSCFQEKGSGSEDVYGNTTETRLLGEHITFKKPNSLKRTYRDRLKEDLPLLKNDSVEYANLQRFFESVKFEDAEIDMFVDTTTGYRLIVMFDVVRIDFGKNEVAIIRDQIKERNRMQALENPNLRFGKLEATLKGNKQMIIAKYKYDVTDKFPGMKLYSSLYYLTKGHSTLVVYEFSDKPEDLERYLWSVRT